MTNTLSKEQLDLLNSIKELQAILSSAILTSSEMVQIESMTKKKKEQLVYSVYFKNKRKKEFYACKDGRVKSYDPQFIAQDTSALIDKLYEYYFGTTLREIFKKWVLRRQKLKTVSPKTLEEDVGIWKRNLEDTEIANTAITEIKPRDLLLLFLEWTGNGFITRKEFSNRKRVLNGIFKFAVLEGIRETNPLTDLPCNELKFLNKPPKNKVYSLEDRSKLLNYLATIEQDAYTLAIQLSFFSILRIGEIKCLRWDEDNLNKIFIENQLVSERTMNEDMTFNQTTFVEKSPKGNPYFSVREETINDKGVQILCKMKELNPNGKYLFMYEGRPLTTTTFNRRLKKYCDAINIEYHSSHGIRFTSASICNAQGMSATKLQPLLGHSNLNMTHHYLRLVEAPQQGIQMKDILS